MKLTKRLAPHFEMRLEKLFRFGGVVAFRHVMGMATLAIAGVTRAELIPANRLVDWTPGVAVGVPGGIPTNRSTIIDVTKPPYNADRTGQSDTAGAIQRAIEAAPRDSIVYLPAGTYRCDSTLYIGHSKDGITLRGDGSSTIIDSRAGTGIFVGVASDYMWNWPMAGNIVTAGLRKGSSTITIADTTEFAVGQLLHFSVENDDRIPVLGTGGGNNFRRQMGVITGKTPTSLTFSPPLYDDYGNGTLIAKVHRASLQTDWVGLEDFTLDLTNGSAIFGIQFEQCYASWIKSVRVINAANYHFNLYDSSRCEIREAFADRRKAQGTNGAGLLCGTISGCLIEDNIFYKNFPLIEVTGGSSGNVFAYNFCEDSSVYGVVGSAINTNHGPHNSYNLYEGNVAANLQSDGYFGGSSRDTIFRNWFHATAPGLNGGGVTIILNRFTRDYSIVGNLLGSSGLELFYPYSFGNPNMGNGSWSGTVQPSQNRWWADWGTAPGPSGFQEKDLDVEATAVLKGNYQHDKGAVAATEALHEVILPSSLYRTSKPTWFGTLQWPAFDSSNPNLRADAIPAGHRFITGSYPVNDSTPRAPSNVKIFRQTE